MKLSYVVEKRKQKFILFMYGCDSYTDFVAHGDSRGGLIVTNNSFFLMGAWVFFECMWCKLCNSSLKDTRGIHFIN